MCAITTACSMSLQYLRMLTCALLSLHAYSCAVWLQFKLGQTVEFLKQYVEVEYGIPMSAQRLFLDNSAIPMMDPLSLLDYPEAKGSAEIFVRVDGVLPAESKK